MLKRAVHPGLVLREELAKFGVTPTEFARQIGVPPNRVSQIINGKRAITGDTALRFGQWFGVEPEFWLNLQTHFDLAHAGQELGKTVALAQTYRGQDMRRGFWSYVHKDDEAEGGRISRLAREMVKQYEMITGDTIELFLDKDGIAWGDEWRKKIDDNLASVEFFIPVMTPRYFKSSECRLELNKFVRRAKQLGRLELLLPLYYLDVPLLNSDGPTGDDLISAVREIQRLDWRHLRFEDITSGAYRRTVADMAGRLADANKRLEEATADKTVLKIGGETDEDDTPGLIDRLAEFEEVVKDEFIKTLVAIRSQIEIVGEVMKEGNSAANKVDSRNTFARKVQVARKAAIGLTVPTDELAILTNRFESQLHKIDDGIRIIIERAPSEIEENPDTKEDFCVFCESVRGMSRSSHDGLNAVQEMSDAAVPLERMSRDLRPVVRRLRQALTIMVEGREVSDDWISLIEASGIDCQEFEGSNNNQYFGQF